MRTLEPNFWEDARNAQIIMKNLRLLKQWVEKFDDIQTIYDELKILVELSKQVKM